jgi:hypothetical protein
VCGTSGACRNRLPCLSKEWPDRIRILSAERSQDPPVRPIVHGPRARGDTARHGLTLARHCLFSRLLMPRKCRPMSRTLTRNMANMASDKDTSLALRPTCVSTKRSCCTMPRTLGCTGEPVAWTHLCIDRTWLECRPFQARAYLRRSALAGEGERSKLKRTQVQQLWFPRAMPCVSTDTVIAASIITSCRNPLKMARPI